MRGCPLFGSLALETNRTEQNGKGKDPLEAQLEINRRVERGPPAGRPPVSLASDRQRPALGLESAVVAALGGYVPSAKTPTKHWRAGSFRRAEASGSSLSDLLAVAHPAQGSLRGASLERLRNHEWAQSASFGCLAWPVRVGSAWVGPALGKLQNDNEADLTS